MDNDNDKTVPPAAAVTTEEQALSDRKKKEVVTLDWEDLTLGAVLGRGCFAHVYELSECSLLQVHNNDDDDDEKKKKTYAVKCLRPDLKTARKFRLGVQDLGREAELLSSVSHPGIISLIAVSTATREKEKEEEKEEDDLAEGAKRHFLVLSQLEGTLTSRVFETWKAQRDKLAQRSTWWNQLWNPGRIDQAQGEFLVERLSVARNVASALAYLHEKGIVYRDLKADNVGFLQQEVQLFDFGLARQVPDDNGVRMTGMVGSLPHMAPEVFHQEVYDVSADVYSFAILLWVMLTLEMPYIELALDLKVLKEQVFTKGYRPPLSTTVPESLHDLLRRAWHVDAHQRPSMTVILQQLETVMKQHEDELTVEAETETTTTSDVPVSLSSWWTWTSSETTSDKTPSPRRGTPAPAATVASTTLAASPWTILSFLPPGLVQWFQASTTLSVVVCLSCCMAVVAIAMAAAATTTTMTTTTTTTTMPFL